jgi:hypothetical protein
MPTTLRTYSTGRGYWTTRDPYATFSTKAAASAWAQKLAGQKYRSNRTYTAYTVLVGKANRTTGKYSSLPQGPHSIAHNAVWAAVLSARRNNQLQELFDILDQPGDVFRILNTEFSDAHAKRDLADKLGLKYQKYYQKAGALLIMAEGKPLDDETAIGVCHALTKTLSLHPHATYAYKGKGASKKALKGKGERSGTPVRDQIDRGFRATYNDPDAEQGIEDLADTLQEFIDIDVDMPDAEDE